MAEGDSEFVFNFFGESQPLFDLLYGTIMVAETCPHAPGLAVHVDGCRRVVRVVSIEHHRLREVTVRRLQLPVSLVDFAEARRDLPGDVRLRLLVRDEGLNLIK